MTDAELDRCRHDGTLLHSIVAQQVKLQRKGRDLKGCCPFHPDDDPSFVVYEDGHFHCFGCNEHGTVFDYVMRRDQVEFARAVEIVAAERGIASAKRKTNGNGRANGETWLPIVPPPADALRPADGLLRCDILHEYCSPDDRLLCYIRRVEAKGDKRKQFWPLTFGVLNGKRGWHARAPDAPRPLYGLNRLSHAAPGATVILCEGEKKADAVQRMFPDMVGLSWMGGKNADDKTDFGPITCCDVILWPDADADGGGQAVMARIAKRLLWTRTVDTTGLPDSFDAWDLERECEDPEAWLQARLREPKTGQEEHFSDAETAPSLLGIWNAGLDDYVIPPREWLLGNIFCKKFLSSLLADGAVGKTALRIAQILSLVVDRSLTGEHVFRRCRALIVSFEDDKDELRRRVYAAMLHYGIKPNDVEGWLFLAAPKGLKLAKMVDGSPQADALAQLLREATTTLHLDILCLDPFIKTHSVGENDNNAIDFVCDLLASIAIDLNCAVDFPHHTNKGVATPGDANRGRGASSAKDAGRLVYTLTPMTTDEGDLFGLGEAERRSLVRLDSGKVNISPPSAEAKWFRLLGQSLGNSSPDYPRGDEVQTVEPWQPPDTWAALDNLLLNRILDAIDAGMADGQRYSAAGAAGKRAAWLVVQQHSPEKSEQACRAIIKTWVKSGTLFPEDYADPVSRKGRVGLRVNPNKRPT